MTRAGINIKTTTAHRLEIDCRAAPITTDNNRVAPTDRAPPLGTSNGLEPGADGLPVGRDPRDMSHAELQAIGYEPMSPGRAIRLRCLDCCGEQPAEVRFCTATRCALWVFRMGANPWRSERQLSDEQRERATATLNRAREARRSGSQPGPDERTAMGAISTPATVHSVSPPAP